jgi:ATP-binding cassette subfamily C protein CydD
VEPLRALLRGRSALLITHDARLLRCADRILRLEGGRVTEPAGPTESAA